MAPDKLVTNSLIATHSTAIIIFALVYYLLAIYPVYYMFKAANLKNPWIAFIPIANSFKMLNLANMSGWIELLLIVVSVIPILGYIIVLIFSIYITIILSKNFGLGTLGTVLMMFFGLFVEWYIVLSKQKFVGEINSRFRETETKVVE